MTIKVGDWAIVIASYKPELVQITKVTEKTVHYVYSQGGKNWRASKQDVSAYGEDRVILERAIERLVSVAAEATRRRIAAGQYERDKSQAIFAEVMGK